MRAGEAQLAALLERSAVVMRAIVLGELACGNLNDGETLPVLWRNLPQLTGCPAVVSAALITIGLANPIVRYRPAR